MTRRPIAAELLFAAAVLASCSDPPPCDPLPADAKLRVTAAPSAVYFSLWIRSTKSGLLATAGRAPGRAVTISANRTDTSFSLRPFSVYFARDCQQGIVAADFTSFEANFEPSTCALIGSATGTYDSVDGDQIRESPLGAPVSFSTSVPAPLFVQPPTTKLPVHAPIDVEFTEVVRPAARRFVALSAGPLLVEREFEDLPDPNAFVGAVRIRPPGHLPFGSTVTIAADPSVANIAGIPVAGPPWSAATVADPGLLSNVGFEDGNLAGFHVHGAVSLKQDDAHAGKYSALLEHLDSSALTFRIALPSSAKFLNFAAKPVSSSPVSIPVTVSTSSARVSTSVEIKAPVWTAAQVDVAAFAGHEIAATIGQARAGCPGPQSQGALLDSISIE